MDRFSHHAGQISLVGFCIFGKSPEATEGSRGFMEYTSKSSIGGIYFPNFGRVHEGSQGSWEWYMKVKNGIFCIFCEKKTALRYYPDQLFLKHGNMMNLCFPRLLCIIFFGFRVHVLCDFQ